MFYALNPLNHNVISLSVTNLKNKIFARSTEKAKHIPKCAWNRATDKHLDDYRIMLNNRITDIKDNCDLFLCTDITCENTQHKQKIDKICVSLIYCCIDCSKLTIPITKLNGRTMPAILRFCDSLVASLLFSKHIHFRVRALFTPCSCFLFSLFHIFCFDF